MWEKWQKVQLKLKIKSDNIDYIKHVTKKEREYAKHYKEDKENG